MTRFPDTAADAIPPAAVTAAARTLPRAAVAALSLAHQHARLCDAVEQCAPEVTATYLQAAYARMKLPITVSWGDPMRPDAWCVYSAGLGLFFPYRSHAVADYLSLCRELLSAPASTSPARQPAVGAR